MLQNLILKPGQDIRAIQVTEIQCFKAHHNPCSLLEGEAVLPNRGKTGSCMQDFQSKKLKCALSRNN